MCFTVAELFDWLIKSSKERRNRSDGTLTQPIKCKTKINHHLTRTTFPAGLQPVACLPALGRGTRFMFSAGSRLVLVTCLPSIWFWLHAHTCLAHDTCFSRARHRLYVCLYFTTVKWLSALSVHFDILSVLS